MFFSVKNVFTSIHFIPLTFNGIVVTIKSMFLLYLRIFSIVWLDMVSIIFISNIDFNLLEINFDVPMPVAHTISTFGFLWFLFLLLSMEAIKCSVRYPISS